MYLCLTATQIDAKHRTESGDVGPEVRVTMNSNLVITKDKFPCNNTNKQRFINLRRDSSYIMS